MEQIYGKKSDEKNKLTFVCNYQNKMLCGKNNMITFAVWTRKPMKNRKPSPVRRYLP